MVSKKDKNYIKDNLEKNLRPILKDSIQNLSFDVDKYFEWLDETIYTWKKHRLSFGQNTERYKTENLDNIIANLKTVVIILKAKNDNLDSNIDAIRNIVLKKYINLENDDLRKLIDFLEIRTQDDEIKKCEQKISEYYKNEFIKKSLEIKNLSTDFIESINSCKNIFLKKLKSDLDNFNGNENIETYRHDFSKCYILKKDLYSDKNCFTDTTAYSETLAALESCFLDSLTRLDEASFSSDEIKQILNKGENLEEYVLLGNFESNYLGELEQHLSTFPIKKSIPEYTKTILVKDYYADVKSVDISMRDLTLDSLSDIHKINFIRNEIIYNYANEDEKYYLYDDWIKFDIDKNSAEEYLKNNYIMIKVSCVIYTNKNNSDL